MKKIFILASIACLLSCTGKSNDQQTTATVSDSSAVETTTTEEEETGMLPRTILGCTLGETGLAQAKKILKAKGYTAKEVSEDGCPSLYFEKKFDAIDHKWDGVILQFYDGSLIRVELLARGADVTYAQNLFDKYGDNYCIRKEHDIYLNDDRTSFRYSTSDPDDEYEYEDNRMTITDFERNDLLPKGKDRMELY